MKDDEIKEFWKRVNSLIKQRNTTQHDISVLCNPKSPRRLQNLSTGNRLPDAEEIVIIAKALGTSAEYLITGSEQLKEQSKVLNLYNFAANERKPLMLSVMEQIAYYGNDTHDSSSNKN